MTRSLTATVIALTALAACQREVSARAPEIQAEHRHDAVFVNGDFEDGGLSGWTVTTYQNKGITYPPASRADLKLLDGGTNKTRIITGPTESIIPSGLDGGASLRIPKYGLNAAVVNELGSGYNVNALTQQFTVTAADVDPTDNKIHVRFALAPVLNSGGHGAADQPYFWVTLTNITKNATLFGTFNFAEQSGVPWQTQGVNFFTDWQSFDITPGNVALAIGDTVKLEVIGAGCSQSGHWGEVFVDGFGPFLPGLQVAASAPQAANAGDNITYTLNYQNRGTGASNNTTVTFNLPANVSYQAISAPGATCTTPAVNATTGAVTCNVGTLNPNAAGSFTVTVKIAALATGKISAGNYAIRADGVSSLLGPLVETNITLLVLYADLMTSISDGVAAVGWGSPYAFTFTVTNAGPSNVVGAPVSWSVPAQLTNATWSCAGSGTCGAAMGSGSIASTASLSSGQSVTYTVNATVISGSSSGSMSNLVGVSAPAGITDSNSSNNQAIDVDSIGTLRAITFAKSGTGTGRVVSSPAAVDCASGCPGSTTSFIDGTLVSVTATATTGHSFSGWSGLCTGTTNPCSFTVSGDATVTAGFAAPSFTITASAGSNGSISPSGATSVPQGSNQTFTFTPATGYHVDTVTVDGASVATASSYTFTNVTAAHTVSATFAIDTFTITASAGANGSVSPASQSANYGSNAGVTITPAAHYHVADVLVDGASVGAVATYTFSNVTAAHTVSASFAIDTFAITASAGANGSVSPASQSANYGSNATVSITPATGYHVASLTVDGATVAAAGSYTFSNVTAAHSISATFAIDTFTITASAGANGSVSPASQTANYGSNATVSITPATGHHVASLTVDGATVAAAGSYTFSNVTAAHSLSATFAIDTFTITASAGANGSVSPASQSASYGSNATVSITPAAHYHVASLTVDGAAATAATSYTFSNVTAAHSVSATFAVDTFTVSGVGDSHGGISCTSPVAYGGSSTCTVTPAAGYELVSLDDSGTPGSASGGTYVASNVTGARTITGVFKKSRGVGCSSQAECGSGQCVDGVCCNTACTGQCESCAVAGSVGTCSPSSGAPAGGRAACASDGSACGGTCDGSSRAACSYPTASTQCRSASCAAGVETHQASCDGAGACPAPVTAACNPYVCGATACGTSCTADAQCSSGFFCSNAVCVPKTQPGTTCSRDGECGTGNCVDGVCCNSACNGQCEACDVTGHVGECSPATGAPHAGRAACDGDGSTCNGQCDGVARASCAYPGANTNCRAASCAAGQATLAAVCDGQGNCPSVQTQACNPYVCGASACKGNCQVDADCSSGNWCSAGLCEPKKLPGITCGADNQCGSGFCTDGVCCNVTCNGQCEACDNSGSVGTCAPVTGAPHAGRRDCASDGSACGGACDGTSRTACAYPTASTQCRGPSCSAGVATVAAACDGAGACPAEQTVACAPFVCGASACLGNCQSDTDCSSGNWCAAGVCTPKRAPGETCGATNQCGSGFCTDGVCCDTACNGQCQACDVPGHAGTCGVVTGAPHGARTECLSDGSGCGGQCDGVNETACSYPTTECRAASCAGGMATLAASCSMGSCPARQEQGCGDFACGVSACNGGCTSDAQCAASSFCSAGVCVTKHPNAGSCSADAQCGSGHCVDGVCCNTACEGQCQACDAAGSVGTCSAVSGAPHGARTACDSDGSRCGGACDGEHADTCAYPSSAVGCVAASCTSGVETHAASCNGAGACSAPTTASCGAFTCGESACTTGCSTDADCGADGFCAAGVCQLGGDKTQWQVQGGLGLGCSQSGGSVAALGLAMLLVLRAARRRTPARARALPRRSEQRGARSVALLAAGTFGLLLAAPASAQSTDVSRTFLLERFQPQAGFGDVLGVQGAQISPHLQPQVSFFASYADVPLRATTVTDSGVRRTLAASQTTFTLGGSVGFLNRFEVGAAIPIVVTQQVGAGIVDPGLAVGGSTVALSDLRLQGKVRIIDVGSFSFAASLPVTLPTAGNAAYAGYAGATATPTAIAQWRGPRRSAVLLDLGVALRQPQQLLNLTVGSAFTWAVGGKVDLLPRFNITALASIGGEVGFLKPSAVQSPLEALVAVKWKPLRSLALTLGAGPGLSPGYGTPRFRILASLGWVPGDDEPYEKPAPLPPPPAPVAKAEPAPAPVPAQAEVAAEPEPVAAAPAPAAEEVKPTPPPEAAAAAPARAFQTLDKVYFATARAEVLPGSLHVLDDVARVMKEDASIAKVRIEAHTDNSAPAAYNQKLSADRAEWVRAYLIQHGVDASRLEAQGFGLSRPLVPNLTVQGKATNRRVEFIVVE